MFLIIPNAQNANILVLNVIGHHQTVQPVLLHSNLISYIAFIVNSRAINVMYGIPHSVKHVFLHFQEFLIQMENATVALQIFALFVNQQI